MAVVMKERETKRKYSINKRLFLGLAIQYFSLANEKKKKKKKRGKKKVRSLPKSMFPAEPN